MACVLVFECVGMCPFQSLSTLGGSFPEVSGKDTTESRLPTKLGHLPNVNQCSVLILIE